MKNNDSSVNYESNSIIRNATLSQSILENSDVQTIFIDGIVQRVYKTINENIRRKSGENVPESVQDNIYARMAILKNVTAESIRIKNVIQLIDVTINQYTTVTSEELAETVFDSLSVMLDPQASSESKKNTILWVLKKIVEQEELSEHEKEHFTGLKRIISMMDTNNFDHSLASKDSKCKQRIGKYLMYGTGFGSGILVAKHEEITTEIEETIKFFQLQINLGKPQPPKNLDSGNPPSLPLESPSPPRPKGNPSSLPPEPLSPSGPKGIPFALGPKTNPFSLLQPPSPPLPTNPPPESQFSKGNSLTGLSRNLGNLPKNVPLPPVSSGGGGGGSMFSSSNSSEQTPQVSEYMSLTNLMNAPSNSISNEDLGGGGEDFGGGSRESGHTGACDGIDLGSCDGIDVGDCGGCEPSIECFIATAVYGDPYAPQVVTLRDFRDTKLINTHAGRLFVSIYYRLSPPIAQILKNSPPLSVIVRHLLDILIKCVKK